MKKVSLLLIFCFVVLLSNAQELISSGGSNLSNTNGSISFSIGELMVETLSDGSNYLTQGFHQPKLSITDISELVDLKFNVLAYPNPTSDVLQLQIESEYAENMNFMLYDVNGRKIIQEKIIDTETSIQLNHLKSGIYILRIFKMDQEIKTFKIIKN